MAYAAIILLTMSTRYIFKNNFAILGLAKNGSQAVKQIYFRNPGWLKYELQDFHSNSVNRVLKHDNPEHTLYIPIRKVWDRAFSCMLQTYSDKIKQHLPDDNLPKLISTLMLPERNYVPKLNYFQNPSIKLFFNKVYFGSGWEGCNFKFFDLNLLSTKFKDFIDPTLEIPYYNIATEDSVKMAIKEHRDLKWYKRKFFHRNYMQMIEFEQQVWNQIKTTKYWLDL